MSTTYINHSDGSRSRVRSDKDGHRVDRINRDGEYTGGESVGTGHTHDDVVDQNTSSGDEVINEWNPLGRAVNPEDYDGVPGHVPNDSNPIPLTPEQINNWNKVDILMEHLFLRAIEKKMFSERIIQMENLNRRITEENIAFKSALDNRQ